MTDWMTNDPTAAFKLRSADRAYDKAAEAAKALPLSAKVEALRVAKAARRSAYDAAALFRATEAALGPEPY